MKSFTAISFLALLVSSVSAQASNGGDTNAPGSFEISIFNYTDTIPPQGPTICNTNPIVTLKDSVLTDQQGRTGEVVANHQFQFDNPIQGPTTSGFSIYSNGSLALNGNTVFYGCNSGGFSNLYSQSIGNQCHLIKIVTYPCSGASSIVASQLPSSTSSSSSSSSTSSTSSSTLTTSTTSTPVAPPPTSTSSTTSVPIAPIPLPPTTSTTASSAPFPAGNATAPAATGTKPVTTSSSPSPSPAATFKGAASVVAVGGEFIAVVAGIAAFALF